MVSKRLTPIQAIKSYCKIQCCAGDTISWKECTLKERCPLYPYRLGKRPITKPFKEYIKKQADLRLNFTKNEVLQDSSTQPEPSREIQEILK